MKIIKNTFIIFDAVNDKINHWYSIGMVIDKCNYMLFWNQNLSSDQIISLNPSVCYTFLRSYQTADVRLPLFYPE